MYQQTSIDAFHIIEEEGLLSKRRFEVYKIIFENQPINCRRIIEIASNKKVTNTGAFSGRLSELQRLGVICEHHVGECPTTGFETIYWATTDKLPTKPEKKKPRLSKNQTRLVTELKITIDALRRLVGLNDVARADELSGYADDLISQWELTK